MLNDHCVTALINLERVKFKYVDIQDDTIRFFVIPEHDVVMCPECSRLTSKLVDATPKVYKDLNVLNRVCHIEIDHRRFECCECFKTFMEPLAFAGPNRHYTDRFESEVYECCQETNAVYAGKKFGISDKTAASIYQSVALQKLEKQTPSKPIEEIGIDEISMHKGHKDFVLVITDITNKRVLEVLPDRKKETVKDFLHGLSESLKHGIKAVAIDLWSAYRSAVEEELPEAIIVADRFHVMQNLNKALDTCRKKEKRASKDDEIWKHAKYTLLKNQEDLSDEERIILAKVCGASNSLKICYDLKESFRAIFNHTDNRDEAQNKLYSWIFDVVKSDLEEYYSFVKTLLNWGENIVNYFVNRLSSGFVEGVNNKIKLIKRKAFGFVNFENFRIKIKDCFS